MRLRSPYECCRVSTDHPRYRGAIRVRDVTTYGGLSHILPSFWVPFEDAGNGVVNTTEYRTNATPTFTRATTAWTRLASGLWASVASGSPRSYYTASLRYAGFLEETSTVNNALWSRDLTNAAWDKTGGGGCTAAKTQIGIDGAANSCSLLTAAGANGTCLQSVTEGSATKTFSAWVKRAVGGGTGQVLITVNNFGAQVDITALINTSTFTLVEVTTAAVTNQVFGFKLVTAGDAIIVDMCQEESQLGSTSPYPATTVAVTRNQDLLTYTLGSFYNALAGSYYHEMTPTLKSVAAARMSFVVDDGGTNQRFQWGLSSGSLTTSYSVINGGVSQAGLVPTPAITAVDALGKMATCYAANDFAAVTNNGTITTDVSGTVPTVTTLRFNGLSSGVNPFSGAVRNLKYFNRRLSNSQLQAMTA